MNITIQQSGRATRERALPVQWHVWSLMATYIWWCSTALHIVPRQPYNCIIVMIKNCKVVRFNKFAKKSSWDVENGNKTTPKNNWAFWSKQINTTWMCVPSRNIYSIVLDRNIRSTLRRWTQFVLILPFDFRSTSRSHGRRSGGSFWLSQSVAGGESLSENPHCFFRLHRRWLSHSWIFFIKGAGCRNHLEGAICY